MTAPNRVLVRDAGPQDFDSIVRIYGHHVLYGLASFEEVPPDRTEIEARFQAIRARGLPYLAAELDGEVLGYAYAGPFRSRPGYRFSVENSVYVAAEAGGRGIGGALLEVLIARCTALGYRQMIAVIGDSGNRASIRLHESKGFVRVGTISDVGFKLGRWVDSVTMQLPLGEGASSLPTEPPRGT
jgi:phosphinothricin acetyltransferase